MPYVFLSWKMQIPAVAVSPSWLYVNGVAEIRTRRDGEECAPRSRRSPWGLIYMQATTRGARSMIYTYRGALESGEVGKLWVERLPRRGEPTRSGAARLIN